MAASSGRLDLSDCELDAIPNDLFELTELEDLSLAGNRIQEVPEKIHRLKHLKRLQLAGNLLRHLPEGISRLTQLQGLWLHGNALEALPGLAGLGALGVLSLAGNALHELPDSLGRLPMLHDLNAAGNCLRRLPPALGALSRLRKLTLHGNQLKQIPAALGQLHALEELWLQCNRLTELPPEICNCRALRELSVADNAMEALPERLHRLTALRTLHAYGNRLRTVPHQALQLRSLRGLWVEGNPIEPVAARPLLDALAAPPETHADGTAGQAPGVLGLDTTQVAGLSVRTVAQRLAVGEVVGAGPGYFKVQPGLHKHGGVVDMDGKRGERLLVVAFGSAPGVPNWGALLRRVRAAAADPAHQCFDVLYVVDGARAWYDGGDAGLEAWRVRVAEAAARYTRVLFLGDSMGATGALLLAQLATCVHVFCPQVDLATSSIRPCRDASWHAVLRERVLAATAAASGPVHVHVGQWLHDLDQVRSLSAEHAKVHVYAILSHRLAYALDAEHKLLPLISAAVLGEMGFEAPPAPARVRLSNFL